MPEDDKKKDDEVLEDEDYDIEEDDLDLGDDNDDLEVDLEEENEKAAREEKERNKAFASMRIENKRLADQLEQVQQQIQQVSQPQRQAVPVDDGIPKTDAEWDALADKDWKKAVDLRSHINAQSVLAKNREASKIGEELDKSKAKVLLRHPELNDNDSEKAKIFLQVLNNNPDYVNHPKGPIYAMRDMEEHMETVLGYKHSDIVSAERSGAKRESERQHRIVLNKGGGKVPTGNQNTVTLSKDEAEFCKLQGLDPKEYAKTKRKLSKSGKEGVSI